MISWMPTTWYEDLGLNKREGDALAQAGISNREEFVFAARKNRPYIPDANIAERVYRSMNFEVGKTFEELIYVFHSPRMAACKVGRTVDIKNRTRNLMTGVPDGRMCFFIFGNRKQEQRIHLYLKRDSIGGEWFNKPVETVVQTVKSVCETLYRCG
jgi:hypothetical protein